jgi:hypothetical protein
VHGSLHCRCASRLRQMTLLHATLRLEQYACVLLANNLSKFFQKKGLPRPHICV